MAPRAACGEIKSLAAGHWPPALAEYDTHYHGRLAYMHIRRCVEGCNVLALSVCGRWTIRGSAPGQDIQGLVECSVTLVAVRAGRQATSGGGQCRRACRRPRRSA